jgi:hypothetical protein
VSTHEQALLPVASIVYTSQIPKTMGKEKKKTNVVKKNQNKEQE